MPQIQKREIKARILQSALDGFLDKGYRNTSMQEIAHSAGIAAGNIYNYFKNKEEVLSTLIGPVLSEVKEIFSIRFKDVARLNANELMGISERKMDAFIKVYQKNRKVFVLLFEKSDSTKFETTKADVIDSMAEAIIRAKNTFTSAQATQEQEILIKAFSAAYINGVISILTEPIGEDLKLKALHLFQPFIRSRLIQNLR